MHHCKEAANPPVCQVRSRRNDEFEFLVSPDAFRFSRHKISDLSSSKMMEQFKNGKEVDLEDCNILTTCTTLPALHEGHVIGFSKILPSGQHLDKFVELCSLKQNGLAMDHDCYIVAKLNHGACLEKQWLPSSFVLQGSGLQPAPKSIRGSKAMSAMESFMELLKGWDFIGQNQLVIKEKLLLECSTTLPTWDKAKSNLTFRIARTDNSEDNDFNCTNFIAKGQPFILDFRTPKPAMVYSSSAKLSNTKVQEVALSSDYDNEDGMIAVTNYGCQAQPASACGLPLSTSSDKLASELESYVAQAQMLRPSFNRRKTAEKNRVTCSPEHDADSSQKQSCTSLLESSRESLLKTSHAGPVKSSSQSLLKPSHSGSHISSIEVSHHPKRKHAGFQKNSCHEQPARVLQGDYLEKRNADTKKSKEGILDLKTKTKAKKDIAKDEFIAKTVVGKDELTTVAKTKANPEVGKNELAVTKMKAKLALADNDELNATLKSKAKPEVEKNELNTKVVDHHKRGELRLLRVSDLKGFLSAKKAKVGGTKEVLIQRIIELLV